MSRESPRGSVSRELDDWAAYLGHVSTTLRALLIRRNGLNVAEYDDVFEACVRLEDARRSLARRVALRTGGTHEQ
jgi:hypothetical protein